MNKIINFTKSRFTKFQLQYKSAYVIALAYIMSLGHSVSAEGGAGFSVKIQNPLGNTNTLDGFLTKILDVVVRLGAIVVVIFIILAGFKYVTARGDTKKIEEANKALTWTIVGAAVLLGAKLISLAIQTTVTQLAS